MNIQKTQRQLENEHMVKFYSWWLIKFGIFITLVLVVIQGNFWFNDEEALQAVQFNNPEYIKIVRIERHVVAFSVVTLETQDGTRKKFDLDTNILWDAEVPDPFVIVFSPSIPLNERD